LVNVIRKERRSKKKVETRSRRNSYQVTSGGLSVQSSKIKNLQKKISALKRNAVNGDGSEDDDADAKAGVLVQAMPSVAEKRRIRSRRRPRSDGHLPSKYNSGWRIGTLWCWCGGQKYSTYRKRKP
jgi:hypothetical protein